MLLFYIALGRWCELTKLNLSTVYWVGNKANFRSSLEDLKETLYLREVFTSSLWGKPVWALSEKQRLELIGIYVRTSYYYILFIRNSY